MEEITFNEEVKERGGSTAPDDETRGKWASKTEFLLSCAGYAIGIGNVWRFPYLCYRNGGGAFLFPYLLMLFLCGIPLFFMETTLGQFSSTGCITLFRIAPLFKGAGYAIIMVNLICTTYYNVIIAYPLLYLFNCMQTKLPWIDCDNPWNTEHCLPLGSTNFNATYMRDVNKSEEIRTKTPADEFFHNQILKISDSVEDQGSIVWPLFVCNALVWIVTYLCIMRGVKTVGKVVYFTATFPFFVLFVLLVRGLTLPGAWDGVFFYLYPQWHQLTNLKVWADAAIQIFFSLGPGWGGIINMASYNDFRNNNKMDSILVPVLNCRTSIFAGFVVFYVIGFMSHETGLPVSQNSKLYTDSILVPVLNCGTSIFAGFVVFSVIGFMSHETGLPVSTVAKGGPGLAFVTYPEAITMLPWPHLWAVLFFAMLFFLGLDSCFVQIEAIITSVTDEYPQLQDRKSLVTVAACAVMMGLSTIFVTNGGMYLLQLFDWYAASISVILICLVEVVIVGWTYGIDNFIRDLEFMIHERIHWWWIFSWKITNPLILTFIFVTTIVFNTTVTYHGVSYPEWSIYLGWSSCLVSIALIPIYMGYRLLYFEEGDLIDRIKSSLTPTKAWGPAKEKHRKEWETLVNYGLALKLLENGRDPYHEKFVELCGTEV